MDILNVMRHHVRLAYEDLVHRRDAASARKRLEWVERIAQGKGGRLHQQARVCLEALNVRSLSRAHDELRDLYFKQLLPPPISRGVFRVDGKEDLKI